MKRFDVAGRSVIVTGAARGIGRAIASTFVEAGAHVTLADIDSATGARAALDLGERAMFRTLDVSDSAAVSTFVADIVATDGVPDILVNNAGICLNAAALETTDDLWHRQMGVTLHGVFYLSREFGRHMIARGRGNIVNISSITAQIDIRPQHHIAYSVSKAGVSQMTRVLGAEWAKTGVRVNAVAPGYVATEMPLAAGSNSGLLDTWLADIPIGRLLEPEEIATAVHFLASDASSAMTGHVLMADGGYTVW